MRLAFRPWQLAVVVFGGLCACDRVGLPNGDPSQQQPPTQAALSPYCSFATDDPSARGAGLITVTGEGARLVHGSTAVDTLATFLGNGMESTDVFVSARHVAIARYVPAPESSDVIVFDHTGNQQFQHRLEPPFSGAPIIGGILSDGTVAVTVISNVQYQSRLVGATGETVVANGAKARLVDGDWLLLEYPPSSAQEPVVRYEWRNPTTGAVVALQGGWNYQSANLFGNDRGELALFVGGAATPRATARLASDHGVAAFDFTDGGGDLLFPVIDQKDNGSSETRTWRVARDLSAVAEVVLGTPARPVLRTTGEMFSTRLDPASGNGSFQPIWSRDGGRTFADIGRAVPSEYGASISVRGKTAAISIREGFDYIEPPLLQLFYDNHTTPQVLRALDHNFQNAELSPDGECLAYFEGPPESGQTSSDWQLVIRNLSTQEERRPAVTTTARFNYLGSRPLAWLE